MTFKEVIENIEALKDKYDLAFMSLFNYELIHKWKEFIYSFNLKEWQKDRVWECLNDDITINELRYIAGFEINNE